MEGSDECVRKWKHERRERRAIHVMVRSFRRGSSVQHSLDRRSDHVIVLYSLPPFPCSKASFFRKFNFYVRPDSFPAYWASDSEYLSFIFFMLTTLSALPMILFLLNDSSCWVPCL